MADERFEVEFVSRVGSYEQGVELLVRTHARLASEFDRSSKAGDRLEKNMLQLAGAQQRATSAAAGLTNASPRLRYALYDVSATATIAGAALLGMSVATSAVAIKFQRDFANVARVTDLTGPALQRLRSDFDDLYRSIPVGFDELTQIGTLAGQLDIADRSLASFTETVAKFSATSNVSVEASATALGRLAQLLPDVGDDYEGLADAILKVGANSISTEAQIIAIASQLAGVATTANLSSKELIALAGTLASVGTAPELSRGAITRLFANIEQAIATSGDRLQAFATVSGRTAAEFKEDWGSDSFAVIQDLFAGIGSSGSDMGSVLRELGITASRDIPVFQKLAQNTDVLAAAFNDATHSAGEVGRQYSIISSTTAEKINLLVNNFNSLLDVLGRGTLGISLFVDAGIGLLQVLQRIAENPVASTLATLLIVVGALSGVFLLFVGVATRAMASALAFRLAVQDMNLASSTTVFSISTLNAALFGTSAAAGRAAVAVRGLGIAMRAIPIVGLALIGAELGHSLQDWYQQASGARLEVEKLNNAIGASGLKDGIVEINEAFSNGLLGTSGLDLARLTGDFRDFENFASKLTGFFTTIDETAANVQDLDASLASLVGSGNIQEAQILFEALSQSEQGHLIPTEKLLEILPQYAAALESAGGSAALAAQDQQNMVDSLRNLVEEFVGVEKSALDVENSIHSLGQSLADNGTAFDRFSVEGRENMSALLDVINQVAAQTPGDAAATAANLQALFDSLVQGAGVSANSLLFLSQMIASLTAQAGGKIGKATVSFNGLFDGIATGGKKAAKGAGGAGKAVRTLLDYAKELEQVISRSFDIRFGSQSALDKITTSWMDLNEEIAEYQRKVAALTADRAIKSYFLEVAELYGDALRAGVLRSEIADIDAELADATAGASKALTGNSKAATTNRKRITDLLNSYGDYIQALAAGGADQATLNAAVAQSRTDFLAQASALGYADAELLPYIAHFNDMATAIERVPRNITVAANTNPALQALNELEAKVRSLGGSYPGPTIDDSGLKRYGRAAEINAEIARLLAAINRPGMNSTAISALQSQIYNLSRLLQSNSYATGGYTGNGGKFQPKGVVHGGEFVFDKRATANAGVGNLYAMMKAFRNGKGYAMGGYVPTPVPVSSGGMMGLGPDAMRELRGIKDAIRTIQPGYLFPEDVSRISQEGDRRRRNAGEL